MFVPTDEKEFDDTQQASVDKLTHKKTAESVILDVTEH